MVVQVDVPGIDFNDVELSVEGDTLVIRGGTQVGQVVSNNDFFHRERAIGVFSRAVTLPEGTDREHIEMTYENGVLEVSVPFTTGQETRKIPIEGEE